MKKLDIDKFHGKVLQLLTQRQPQELSYSALARMTGVPRSTLYYYFGKEPESLFDDAVQFGIKKFVHLYEFDNDLSRFSDWSAFQKKRLFEALVLIRKYPWAPGLYFRYRNHAGRWGQQIREVEDVYCKRIALAWENFHKRKVDPKAIRLASYLKLGLLWGIASEKEVWFADQDDRALELLAAEMTQVVTFCLSRENNDSN